MVDDPIQRSRVYGRIAPLVMEFARNHVGQAFHADDLLQDVLRNAPEIAPDSPGRILRELRLEGRLNYVVINRRQSLYQFRGPVSPLPALPPSNLKSEKFLAGQGA